MLDLSAAVLEKTEALQDCRSGNERCFYKRARDRCLVIGHFLSFTYLHMTTKSWTGSSWRMTLTWMTSAAAGARVPHCKSRSAGLRCLRLLQS